MNSILLYLFCLIVGYLIGSILFADLITRYVKNVNIRELGNGNPGAYNVFRNVSKFWGVVSGLLDAMKALGPMLIASHYFRLPDIALACLAIGAILGHGLPIYYRFKGGEPLRCSWECIFSLFPMNFLLLLPLQQSSCWVSFEKNMAYGDQQELLPYVWFCVSFIHIPMKLECLYG